MYLNENLLPLKDYHKAKKLMWNPQDISYEQDQRDWAGFDDQEKDLIRRSIGLFVSGEAYVTHDLAPLLVALRHSGEHLEEEMFLTSQLFEESKHVEFFADFIKHVIGEAPNLEDIAGGNYQQLFEVELAKALGALLTDHSLTAQANAVCTYHMVIEGVLAETGYYGIFTALKKQGLLPGLIQGLELVQRDEARHIAFGLHLLTRYIEEQPDLWNLVETRINSLLPVAQGIFLELLESFLPDIPFEVDLNDLVAYAGKQYMARMGVLERVKRTD